jgi:REP element-mobilizing transposase RayT
MKTKTLQREFGFTHWGGKRRGAGRKPKGERAGVSHAKRPRLCVRHPVLVTLRLREGLPSLRYDDSHEVLRRAFDASSEGEAFRVVEYSAQSNHVHLIVEAQDERALARGMNGLASRIARALNRLWRRRGRVFSDRYHARSLETPRAVRIALVYVLQNARKHGAWSARGPDPYSSGASFEGWRGSGEGADSSPRRLPRARTWLLSVGWRRHGLIGPWEGPQPTKIAGRRWLALLRTG